MRVSKCSLLKSRSNTFACLLPSADFLVLLTITGMWDTVYLAGLRGKRNYMYPASLRDLKQVQWKYSGIPCVILERW